MRAEGMELTYPATHPRGNGDAPALTPVASVRPDFQRMASVPRRIQEPSPPSLPTAFSYSIGHGCQCLHRNLLSKVNAAAMLSAFRYAYTMDDEASRASHG